MNDINKLHYDLSRAMTDRPDYVGDCARSGLLRNSAPAYLLGVARHKNVSESLFWPDWQLTDPQTLLESTYRIPYQNLAFVPFSELRWHLHTTPIKGVIDPVIDGGNLGKAVIPVHFYYQGTTLVQASVGEAESLLDRMNRENVVNYRFDETDGREIYLIHKIRRGIVDGIGQYSVVYILRPSDTTLISKEASTLKVTGPIEAVLYDTASPSGQVEFRRLVVATGRALTTSLSDDIVRHQVGGVGDNEAWTAVGDVGPRHLVTL